MDFWPGQYVSPQSGPKKGRKRKAPQKTERITSNYPVLDNGSLASAIELKGPGGYEWLFPAVSNRGRLRIIDEPRKFYPSTRAPASKVPHTTLRQRAEQGARFLRTYHPDVDLPFELIRDELHESETVTDSLHKFDPFLGSTITAVNCNEGQKKRNILVAFPTGVSGSDLNLSPIYFKIDSLQFTPRSSPAWSFETPIQQIISTFPASRAAPDRKKDSYLTVRTYNGASIFDLSKQVTYGLVQSPPRLKELSVILPSDIGGGNLMDMSFIRSSVPEMFLIDSRGCLHKYTLRNERKFSHYLLDGNRDKLDDEFWSVRARNSQFEGLFCSSKSVRSFDTRVGVATSELHSVDGETLVTSIEVTDVDHLLCASTTTEVIWIDDRFPKRPLLGSRHHRNFDRTLNVQSVSVDGAMIALLSSRLNGYVSAFGVTSLENGPMQSCINAGALPFTGATGTSSFSRTIIRHPNEDSFSLLELDDQGSIRRTELLYSQDGADGAESDGRRRPRLTLHWSGEVKELDKKSDGWRPDHGTMGGRELVEVDLSELYEKLFNADEEASREIAESNAESMYDLLDRMPSFWRTSDMEATVSATLFDVAFNSNEDPIPQARADFLTGTPLNSVRGYRALRQGRLNLSSGKMKALREQAGWHYDLASTLGRIDPDVFSGYNYDNTDGKLLSPYSVNREDAVPEADQRESESAQQLALDLALSKDVLRSAPFISTQQRSTDEALEAAADTLSVATEKLTLNARTQEPPQVTFGSCRPARRGGKKVHYKEAHTYQNKGDDDEMEDDTEKPVEMPLGVRLLLNEWVVGTDPKDYAYVDPYDLEERHAEKSDQTRFIIMTQESMLQSQSQAPPTIVAAKKVASTQPKQPPAIVPSSSQPPTRAHLLPRRLQTQGTYSQVFGTQPESQEPESQLAMASTQILPGPFGGRPQAAPKKKPPKKRLGGF